MHSIWCGRFLRMAQSLLLLVSGVVAVRHYPTSDLNCKACTRLKNTITVQAPICTLDAGGKFTDEGIKACTETLKQSCPEFNLAECLMYNISFPEAGSPVRPVPCCRLKYKARCVGLNTKATTWMEIYYALQNGASPNASAATNTSAVYDIVEVHRKVLEKEAFPQREQEDWPASVIDASGERGLHWVTIDYANLTQGFPKTPISATKICQEKDDKRCTEKVVNYLQENYNSGFENNMVPNVSELELTSSYANLSVTTELKPTCIYIVADNVSTPACQVLFVRRSVFSPDVVGMPAGTVLNTTFVFLEAQVYDPSTDTAAGTVLRYAYWSKEDMITRESIFSNCKI